MERIFPFVIEGRNAKNANVMVRITVKDIDFETLKTVTMPSFDAYVQNTISFYLVQVYKNDREHGLEFKLDMFSAIFSDLLVAVPYAKRFLTLVLSEFPGMLRQIFIVNRQGILRSTMLVNIFLPLIVPEEARSLICLD